MLYSAEHVAKLVDEHNAVAEKLSRLRDTFIRRVYKTPTANEHAINGFARRVGILARCIDNVYAVLPPSKANLPSIEELDDAAINLQAFVLNIFGCCDNLAWIWVSEKAVTLKDGQPLSPTMIGLGEGYWRVRETFSEVFRSYLDDRKSWFTHVKDFRDALAHRIPLYVPPYAVPPKHADQHRFLEVEANKAAAARNWDGYDQLLAQQEALGQFHPVMAHSLVDGQGTVAFHPQMFADFNTVDELAFKFIEEMER